MVDEVKLNLLKSITECFTNLLGVDVVKELTQKALDAGVSATDILGAMEKGLDEVSRRYDAGEYFLSDLIFSGIMATELIDLVKPRLEALTLRSRGKVVIGTVKGDIHDIGKGLVATMLSVAGFEVVDIGVDVTPEKFIESIRKHKPDILAMSCLLTAGMPEMEKTVRMIREEGLNVKILVGGRSITSQFAEEIGADSYGKDAFEAAAIARRLVGR